MCISTSFFISQNKRNFWPYFPQIRKKKKYHLAMFETYRGDIFFKKKKKKKFFKKLKTFLKI